MRYIEMYLMAHKTTGRARGIGWASRTLSYRTQLSPLLFVKLLQLLQEAVTATDCMVLLPPLPPKKMLVPMPIQCTRSWATCITHFISPNFLDLWGWECHYSILWKRKVGLERLNKLLSILQLVSLKPDLCAPPNPLLGTSSGIILLLRWFSCYIIMNETVINIVHGFFLSSSSTFKMPPFIFSFYSLYGLIVRQLGNWQGQHVV